ncbi:MAG: hypothetical protein CM1200mP12_05900 [Gammaproteobacteria bacterium]|nr:MAG: hypothetical protein CM1200mP12_05900 [Gammaproteobacteria bacterium]
MDGVYVNGVDVISWNEEGKITEFKVIVRPLQGSQHAPSKDASNARKHEVVSFSMVNKAQSWLVHIFTASGAFAGFLSLQAGFKR